MTTCKNCFAPIGDMRKETRCSTCSSPLHKECAINQDGASSCDVCYTVKQEKKSKFTFDLPDVIRRTHIETYKTCPHKFYLEVIKGYAQPPNAYTQVGSDVHELIEQGCIGLINSKEQMLALYQPIWDNYNPTLFDDEKQKERMYQRAINSIDTFFEVLPTLPHRPFTTEQKIEFEVGEDLPKVSITMDRIDEDGEELDVRDWKTGKVMVGKKFTTDLQAPLYIHAIKKKFNRPVRKFHYYYLDEGKERVFERVNDDVYVCRVLKKEYHISITEALREVNTLFSRMRRGDFNIPQDTRSMYFACKMCHLREQGHCEGADRQAWKNINEGVFI